MTSLLYLANLRLPTEKAYGIQITKMCEAFADQGVQVTLFLPTRRNAIVQDIFSYYQIKKNFLIKKVFSPDFYLPGNLDRLAVLVKNFISAIILTLYACNLRADIIYARDELPLFFTSCFRKNLCFEAHKYSSHRRGFYRWFNRAGVKIIAITNGVRDEFIRIGYKPEHITVAHDGVDVRQFTIGKTKPECRDILSLPLDKILVVYTGHLYEWKGAHVLAEAATNLDERFVVIFVGGTQHDVRQYKKRYENQHNIVFLGWRPHSDIPLYLKAADIVVLPNSAKEEISRTFTSPLKMFEYMASGTPIIASDLPSIREVLSDESAFFTLADNPDMLARKLQEVSADLSVASKRGHQAQQVVAQYSWKSRAGQILPFINTHP